MIEFSENDWRIFRDEEEHWFPDEPEPEVDENQLYQELKDMEGTE